MAEKQPRKLAGSEPLTKAERRVLDELDTGEVATGRAEAVMFHKGRVPEVFGDRLEGLHPAMQQLAHRGSPNCPAP